MQLGLPIVEEQSIDADSSDDEKDSGGADTNQDSDYPPMPTRNDNKSTLNKTTASLQTCQTKLPPQRRESCLSNEASAGATD